MATKLIEDNMKDSLPYDDFGYVTLENVIENNIPFLCLSCHTVCQLDQKYTLSSLDEVEIECANCERKYYCRSSTKHKQVRTPSFNIISKFDYTKLRIKNHEYSGH